MTAAPASVAIAQRKASEVPRALRGMLSLEDFERKAKALLPKAIFEYVRGGVETDWSLNTNRSDFARYALRPKLMRDTSGRTLETTLFGQRHALPFGIAPMGFSAVAAYDGDVALAVGAARAGSFAICSAASVTPLERVAKAGESRWFQAYIPGDEARIGALIDRLLGLDFDTLVITGDVPVAGNRENNARTGFDAPFRLTPHLLWQGATHPRWTIGTLGREIATRGMPHFENMEAVQGPPLFSKTLVRSTLGRDRLCWDNIAFIRKRWPGKLVVKGVLHPDDAREAERCGCDGIIVSNHGGRQLDGAISPLQALPEIRAAVPDMTVMFDSGIRRGTDVIKAMALGADFTFVGRPFLFAAAAYGVPGVRHAMRLLSEEIDRDLALLGLVNLTELRTASPLVAPL